MSGIFSTVELWRADEPVAVERYFHNQMMSRAGCQARRSLNNKKMLCEYRPKIWGRQ